MSDRAALATRRESPPQVAGNAQPTDDEVHSDVEQAFREAGRPLRLFDLTLRCRGRVAQLEAARDKLVEQGLVKRVRYAWVYVKPTVRELKPSRAARRVSVVDDQAPEQEGSVRRPPPPEPLPLGPMPPILTDRPAARRRSKYDPLVPRVVALLESHPGGLDVRQVAKLLRCKRSAALCALQLAWGRGRIDSALFVLYRVYFPLGAEMSEPPWVKTREKEGGRKKGRAPGGPRYPSRAHQAHLETLLPRIVDYIDQKPQPVSSIEVAVALDVYAELATQALRLAWVRGLVEAQGSCKLRRYVPVARKQASPETLINLSEAGPGLETSPTTASGRETKCGGAG